MWGCHPQWGLSWEAATNSLQQLGQPPTLILGKASVSVQKVKIYEFDALGAVGVHGRGGRGFLHQYPESSTAIGGTSHQRHTTAVAMRVAGRADEG